MICVLIDWGLSQEEAVSRPCVGLGSWHDLRLAGARLVCLLVLASCLLVHHPQHRLGLSQNSDAVFPHEHLLLPMPHLFYYAQAP